MLRFPKRADHFGMTAMQACFERLEVDSPVCARNKGSGSFVPRTRATLRSQGRGAMGQSLDLCTKAFAAQGALLVGMRA